MKRRQVLAAAAGVATGMLGMAHPVAASQSASELAVDFVGMVGTIITAYRAQLEAAPSKQPSSAFSELEAFHRKFSFRGHPVSVTTELGLVDLRFVVSGHGEVIHRLQKGLAEQGHACEMAANTLTLVVKALPDVAPLHRLMVHVPSNTW
ncbi:MAG TPA: hypothetical protein VM581_02910 [Magnetospirillaceae bacterium]|nr:hypothetical protein [Magnetospirillaceae bacterium]